MLFLLMLSLIMSPSLMLTSLMLTSLMLASLILPLLKLPLLILSVLMWPLLIQPTLHPLSILIYYHQPYTYFVYLYSKSTLILFPIFYHSIQRPFLIYYPFYSSVCYCYLAILQIYLMMLVSIYLPFEPF